MIRFNVGPAFKQYVIVITANLTFFQFGITIGWMSPATLKLRDLNQTVLPEPITETEQAWILSIGSLLSITGYFFSGYLANRFGRKYTIVLAVLPRVVGCFLIQFSSRVWMLLLGRSLCGVSDSVVIITIATYTSEIASKEIRGGLGTVSQICSAIGSMLMLSIGPFVSYFTISLIQTVIMVVTFVPLLFLPESPYFLYSKGKLKEANKILTFLRGNSNLACEEIKEYSTNTIEEIAWKDLIKDRVFIKTIGIIIYLGVSSEMTGYNAVMFYLQTIFESTGTSLTSEISSVIIGCIQVFACVCTILLIDWFGRKPVITITFFVSAVGLVGMGTFFNLKDKGTNIDGILNYLPLISLILVIFCFNAGIGAVVWTLMAELLDGPTRAVGVSIGAFVASVFTFLTIRYFASVAAAIGPASTYWVFSGCCVASCIFVALFVPETKRKPFSQIQYDLGRR